MADNEEIYGWRVSLLLLSFATITLAIELSLTAIERSLRNHKGLLLALNSIKNELLYLGVLSLILSAFQDQVAKICIKSKHGDHEQEEEEPLNPVRLLRRLLGEGTDEDPCAEGKESLWPQQTQEDTHLFLFSVACTHIVYSTTTIYLTRLKVKTWKKWELEAQKRAREGDVSVMELDAKWLLTSVNSAFVWRVLVAFYGQFRVSVTQPMYHNLRLLFIERMGLPYDFDYHRLVLMTMEEELAETVRLEWQLWLVAVFWFALPTPSYVPFWSYGIALATLLLVGAKLVYIAAQLCVQIALKFGDNVLYGRMDSDPRHGLLKPTALGRSSLPRHLSRTGPLAPGLYRQTLALRKSGSNHLHPGPFTAAATAAGDMHAVDARAEIVDQLSCKEEVAQMLKGPARSTEAKVPAPAPAAAAANEAAATPIAERWSAGRLFGIGLLAHVFGRPPITPVDSPSSHRRATSAFSQGNRPGEQQAALERAALQTASMPATTPWQERIIQVSLYLEPMHRPQQQVRLQKIAGNGCSPEQAHAGRAQQGPPPLSADGSGGLLVSEQGSKPLSSHGTDRMPQGSRALHNLTSINEASPSDSGHAAVGAASAAATVTLAVKDSSQPGASAAAAPPVEPAGDVGMGSGTGTGSTKAPAALEMEAAEQGRDGHFVSPFAVSAHQDDAMPPGGAERCSAQAAPPPAAGGHEGDAHEKHVVPMRLPQIGWKRTKLRCLYRQTYMKTADKVAHDVVARKRASGFQEVDAAKFFWFHRPQLISRIMTYAYFENSLSIALILWTLIGGFEAVSVWTGVHQRALIILLVGDCCMALHSALYVMPLCSLLQPVGSHCRRSVLKSAIKRGVFPKQAQKLAKAMDLQLQDSTTTKHDESTSAKLLGRVKALRQRMKAKWQPEAGSATSAMGRGGSATLPSQAQAELIAGAHGLPADSSHAAGQDRPSAGGIGRAAQSTTSWWGRHSPHASSRMDGRGSAGAEAGGHSLATMVRTSALRELLLGMYRGTAVRRQPE